MKIGCAIVAAGQGIRLGEEWKDIPKALVPLLGRPMLYYSLNVFDQIDEISHISISVPKPETDTFRKLIKAWGFSKKIVLEHGGKHRSESVVSALKALSDDAIDLVLIHDAARPCITVEMVKNLIKFQSAVTLAHPASDTLRECEGGTITGEVDRSRIINLETPQMFPFNKILEFHNDCKLPEELPDDTSLFTKSGESVMAVFHEGSNIKVTWPEDIYAAEGILFGRGWSDVSEGED